MLSSSGMLGFLDLLSLNLLSDLDCTSNALEGLLEEGYVYTTVDNEHILISR